MALRRASEHQQQASGLHRCSPSKHPRIRQVSGPAYDQRGKLFVDMTDSRRVCGTPPAKGGSSDGNWPLLTGVFFFFLLQGETDGSRQIPVRSQEAAPQADGARPHPRAHEAGQAAGPPPGGLLSCHRAAHATHFLQVGGEIHCRFPANKM